MSEQIDVLGVMWRAEQLFNEREYPATYDKLVRTRTIVAELIEAARDCNEWLCRTDREHTAHQRQLAEVLARIGGQP